MMADDETFLLLSAYRDGELSAGEALAMERRLAEEPELRAMADRLGRLSGMVRRELAATPISATLRGRVVRAVGFGDQAPRQTWRSSWQPLAAALLVGLVAGGLIGVGATYLVESPGGPATSDAVVAGHLRALAASQPFDIASSDRHTVKPWFNGRTTIAPTVPDLADKGFPLLGGRIDVVAGQPVPTLVYRHDKHVVSVTIVPKASADLAGEDRRDGSTIEHWTAGDLTYWAVSDLNAKGLRDFIGLFQAGIAREG